MGQNSPKEKLLAALWRGEQKAESWGSRGRDKKETTVNLLEPDGKDGDKVLNPRKPEMFKIGITPQTEFP